MINPDKRTFLFDELKKHDIYVFRYSTGPHVHDDTRLNWPVSVPLWINPQEPELITLQRLHKSRSPLPSGE